MSDTDASGSRPSGRRRERGIFQRLAPGCTRRRECGCSWWAVYFDEHGRRHPERGGPKALAERYGRYWKDALPGRTLREVTPGHVERYAAQRRAIGCADATVNRELTMLRCVFNTAIADGKIETSPVLRRFFVKENNQRVRHLAAEEEAKLRAVLGEEEWPKVAFALHTGFRQGNQFRLRWADVNFDTGMIRASHTKSGEDYFVPMNDELRAVLRALPSRMRSEWVFPTRRAQPRSTPGTT